MSRFRQAGEVVPDLARLRLGQSTELLLQKPRSAQQKRMARLAEVLDEARGLGIPIGTWVKQIHVSLSVEQINTLGKEVRVAITSREAEQARAEQVEQA